METPHELIELITLNTCNLAGLRDRFSDLPEPIILHIFSFLDSNEIYHLTYVCRQFRKLCMSSPNLAFKLEFDSKKCTANCKKLQRFLKGFLNLHNAPEIHRFRLHWFCPSTKFDAKSMFGKWVQKALRKKVQELDIGAPIPYDKAFYLPAAAGIESLRVLKLKLKGGQPKLFGSAFASLESLSLTSLSIPHFQFGDWLCHSCKTLKILNLEVVNNINNLYISHSSLKVLTLVRCPAEDGPDCKISIHCSSLENLAISKCEFENLYLNVEAPSLKDLQISDCETYRYFNISISAKQLQTLCLTMQLSLCVPEASLRGCRIYSENLASLRNATLSLVLKETTLSLGDSMYMEFNSNGLVDFIYSIRYAKILQLNSQIIEALSLCQLPNIKFEHLVHLEVTDVGLDDLDDIITRIAEFVECCSRLKTLKLRCQNNACNLSGTELTNQVCSEVEKFGVVCGNMDIICSVINCEGK